MKPLQLYYYRRADQGLNFGDDLSPMLLNYATGREVAWAPDYQCDVLAIGSILQRTLKLGFNLRRRVAGNPPPIVWGSGLIEAPRTKRRPKLQVAALRGTHTASALAAGDIPLGDPGLLAGEWFQERKKTHRVGIISHYSDDAHPDVDAFCDANAHSLRISVQRSPEEVLRDISRCEVIISSSMHGLIVADAFGIPNFKASFFGKLRGGSYKFDDYASAIGRAPITDFAPIGFDVEKAVANFKTDHFSRIEPTADALKKVIKSLV